MPLCDEDVSVLVDAQGLKIYQRPALSLLSPAPLEDESFEAPLPPFMLGIGKYSADSNRSASDLLNTCEGLLCR
jgi:hypothetical protein